MKRFLFPALAMLAMCAVATILKAADAPTPAPAPAEVALIGCAHIHTPDFAKRMAKRTDIKVKYVWDHDAERAKKYGQILGATVVDDLSVIWSDQTVSSVVICSETDRHLELVTAAAKAKKNIYAEKPLGFSATDSYAMAKSMQEAGVLFQTGYFMRSEPVMQFLKQQVEAGAFGKITRIRGSNTHAGALGGIFDKDYRWMADPKHAGIGGFGDLGTHSLDLMLWIINEPVERVTATTANGTARYEGCDELGEGILVFKSGIIGSLAAGWDDVANPVTLEICGTEGHATVINGHLAFQSKHVPGADGKKPWTELPAALPHAFERYLDAISGKKDVTLVSGAEAAYRAAVMQAMYDAAKEQKWVEVQQPGK